jgi:Holliday junction resolvase RusA-like endonuclease
MIVLPYPPSIHKLFRKHNGSYLSAEYKAWRDEAGWELKRQSPYKHDGTVSVVMEFKAPDKRRRDCDNLIKPILDLLVAHQVIPADDSSVVRQVTARWIDHGEPRVQLMVMGFTR